MPVDFVKKIRGVRVQHHVAGRLQRDQEIPGLVRDAQAGRIFVKSQDIYVFYGRAPENSCVVCE